MLSLLHFKKETWVKIAMIAVIFASLFLVFHPVVAHAGPVEDAAAAAGEGISNALFGSCGGSFGSCIWWIFAHIGIVTMQFSLYILGIVGVLLDLTLLLTFNMGAILAPGTSAGDAVAAGWTIFRDLANLMFIAGFVWVSIAMILQVNVPGGSVGKFIANIIIAALLVNFSYFFTGVAIDASNTLSRLIYTQGVLDGNESLTIGTAAGNRIETIDSMVARITGGGVQNGASGTLSGVGNVAGAIPGSGTVAQGAQPYLSFIGAQFLHQTKLLSALDLEGIKDKIDDGEVTVGITFMIYLGVVFISMTIELFGSMFFVIAARFIILLLLLILSPLLVFRLMGIPPFSAWGEQWFKALVSQLVFLPVFVFLLAVSFRVIAGFVDTFAGSEVSFSSLLGSPSGSEFNTALGLVLLFFIAYGLLKYSKTVAENLAQGKEVPLPGTELIQKPAAEIGSRFGKFAAKTGALPRAAGRSAIGWTLRGTGAGLNALGNATGVKDLGRGVGSRVSDFGKGIGASLGLVDPYTLQKEREARESAKDIGSTLADIARYEAARDKAIADGDLAAERTANESLARAKEKLKEKSEKMYETLGAGGMADELGRLDGKSQKAFLDALDAEKASEVATELRNKGKYKKPEKDQGTGTAGTTATTKPTPDQEKLLAEMRTMNRNQRLAAMRDQKYKEAVQAALAAPGGAAKYKQENGEGSLGELPPDIILKNDSVRHEMDAKDIEVFADREDVSDEEFEAARQKVVVSKRRKSLGKPSDIANPEPPDDGSSTAWIRAQSRRNERRGGDT